MKAIFFAAPGSLLLQAVSEEREIPDARPKWLFPMHRRMRPPVILTYERRDRVTWKDPEVPEYVLTHQDEWPG